MGMARGPAAPMMTDQKRAGFSRAAQRQYLKGVDQNSGADMVSAVKKRQKNQAVDFLGREKLCVD